LEPLTPRRQGTISLPALAKMHPQSREILAALYGQLEHGGYAEQVTAAEALGGMRPADRNTVLKLIAALIRSRDERMPRDLGALALAWVDAYKRGHDRLDSHDPAFVEVTNEIANTAARLSVPVTPVARLGTICVPGEGFSGSGLRLRVIRALGRIGPAAQEAMPLLIQGC